MHSNRFGEWHGTVWLEGAVKRVIVFRFGTTREGKFAAFMDFPDTPVIGKPVIDVTVARDKVTWKAPEIRMDFAGRLSGNSIKGVNKNGKYEVNLTKGKYQPGILDMPAEDDAEVRRTIGRQMGRPGGNGLQHPASL